jgi:hypothetical protein
VNTEFYSEDLKEGGHLGDLDVVAKTILKSALETKDISSCIE